MGTCSFHVPDTSRPMCRGLQSTVVRDKASAAQRRHSWCKCGYHIREINAEPVFQSF